MGVRNANPRLVVHEISSQPSGAMGKSQGAGDPNPRAFPTLPKLLRARALAHPESPAFVYLDHDGAPVTTLSYGELDRQSSQIAAGLRARGLAGERILLQHPQGPEFAVAFFGVLAAGAVAVPAPHTQTRRGAPQRILAIVEDADPRLVLTTPEHEAALTQTLAGRVPVLTADRLDQKDQGRPDPRPAELALLQYTSGSTGVPKGVMIGHSAIMANQRLIAARFGHDRTTVMVSWLPMFHDMGLIGSLLQPIYAGFPCVMLLPDAFLADPSIWLSAISTFRATTAGAPNFAYDYCVDRIPVADRAALDLRSWKVAFNGSEPVRTQTLARFSEAFGPYGFRATSAYPCFGMAEATLLISAGTPEVAPQLISRPMPNGGMRDMVSNGATSEGHEIAIVDPETFQAQTDGTEGEIWARGPSMAMGYWRNPDATAQSFDVALKDKGRGWMRTGDLGLMQDGQLYISGRIKDMIILKGRNHYPQDIEATAMVAHPALRPEGGAAFVVEHDDRVSLVLVHEVTAPAFREPPLTEIAGALRAAVAAHHGLHLAVVALIAPGALPKTTSGKVQRNRARMIYLDGTLPVLGEDRHGPVLRRSTSVSGDQINI